MNVFRCLSRTVQATGLSTLSLRSVCAAERRVCLILSVTDPTESPGDEQRGVRRSARLEADELEESQRTFLNDEKLGAADVIRKLRLQG